MTLFTDRGYPRPRISSGGILDTKIIFTTRRNAHIANAVLATAIPSVCLSVRLSVCHRVGLKTADHRRLPQTTGCHTVFVKPVVKPV